MLYLILHYAKTQKNILQDARNYYFIITLNNRDDYALHFIILQVVLLYNVGTWSLYACRRVNITINICIINRYN